MTALSNHIDHIRNFGFTLIFTFAFTLIFTLTPSTAQAQEAKRDNSPVVKDKNYYLFQGIREFNNKNFTAAKEAFNKVVEEDPGNDAPYYYLANIALENKDIVSGEILLKKAIENDPTNFWYKNLLAKIYITTQKMDKAVEVYEELMAQFPKKTDIYYNLTNLYISQEKTDKAHEVLDKIEKTGGKNENTAITRFNLYRIAKEWDTALKNLVEDSYQVASPRIETILGDLYSEQGKDTIAIIHYRKALKMVPDYPPAMYGEAELHRRNGNFAGFFGKMAPIVSNPEIESIMKTQYFEQLVKMPGFIQKCKPQMDILMESLVDTHPGDSLANHLSSAYFAQTGNREKCREILKKYIANSPENDNENAIVRYLSFLYYSEEWPELEKEAAIAAEKLPHNIEPLELVALAQYQMEKYNDAIATYTRIQDKAIKAADSTVLLHTLSNLGDLYHTTGNHKMAYSCYKKALKLNSNYNPVLNNYAYFLALENKSLKQACRMSKKTVESEPDNATYLDTYAWILHLLGKNQEAKAHLKHAMLYGGTEDADILLHYSQVLAALGEHDLAAIYKEQAARKSK